jgi:hypothetical protein
VHHLGESAVAIENDAVGAERQGAFQHLFDENPIGLLGALETEDLIAVGTGDDERIDLAVADRGQRFLGLSKAAAKVFQLDDGVLSHDYFSEWPGYTFRPVSTLSTFDRSPTIFRRGSGSLLMSVGAAMICWPLASAGC